MVATLNTTVIQNASSSTANITLDTAGNVTGGANLVATIQELKATVDAQAAEITALKVKVGV